MLAGHLLSALEHSVGGAISLSLYPVSNCFPDWDLIEYRDVIVSDGPLLVLTMYANYVDHGADPALCGSSCGRGTCKQNICPASVYIISHSVAEMHEYRPRPQ